MTKPNIEGHKKASGSSWRIPNFTCDRFYRISVTRRILNDKMEQYIYKCEGRQVGVAVIERDQKPVRIAIGGQHEATYDDFMLCELKKDGNSSPNLVINSSFEYLQEGTPTYYNLTAYHRPDYSKPYERFLYGSLIDTTVKHSGKQSWKMILDDHAASQGIQTYDINLPKGQSAAFSIYLKADREPVPAKLHCWEMYSKFHAKDIVITKEWKRYEMIIPKTISAKLRFGVSFKAKSTLWADDLQVEIADKVTPYVPANADKYKFAPKKQQKIIRSAFTAKRIRPPRAINAPLDSWKDQAAFVSPDKFFCADKKPKSKTEAYLGYDNEALYVGVRDYPGDLSKLTAQKKPHDDFAMFNNNHVEIFAAPGCTSKEYFSFDTDYAGTRVDFGPGRNQKWNGTWQSAVQINKAKKSIDYTFRIPFATLAGKGLLSESAFNIGLFNPVNNEWISLFPAPTQVFHAPERFPLIKIDPAVTRCYAFELTAGISPVEDKQQTLQLAADNLTGAPVSGKIVFTLPNKKEIIKEVKLNNGKNRIAFTLPAFDWKNIQPGFRFTDNAGKTRFESKVRCQMVTPVRFFAKFNYFMNEPEARFRIFSNLPDAQDLEAVLTCGKAMVKGKVSSRFELAFPLKPIPLGTHEAQLVIRNIKTGKSVWQGTAPLVKKAYAKGATQINHFRRCITHNGKNMTAFLPLVGMFPIAAKKESMTAQADMLARSGFKQVMVVTARGAVKSNVEFTKLLGERGIDVLFWNDWGRIGTEEQERKNLVYMKGLTNIIGILLVDEPELYLTSTECEKRIIEWRPHFPYQPCIMNNTVMGIPNRFANLNTDILGLDDYITNREGRTVREIISQCDIMWNAGIAENKPCFYFISGENLSNHYREPTSAEQVASVYGCLAKNTTLVSFFFGVPSYPAHWNTYVRLAKEFACLSDIVCDEADPDPVQFSDQELLGITRTHDGWLYIITVNIDDVPRKTSIVLPASLRYEGDVEVVFENRRIRRSGNSFDDQYKPLSRHVYRIKLKK